MKKFFILMMVLLATVNIHAGDDESNFILDLEIAGGTRYKGMQQANLAIDRGYTVCDRVYPYCRYESSLMLYKHDGFKEYGNTRNIGGGAGIILRKTDRDNRLEFTGNVTTSVGGDYRNTSFYGGFRFRSEAGAFIGLGYRYMKSRDVWHDYSAFVLSIAF